jgi:hypothetical protein
LHSLCLVNRLFYSEFVVLLYQEVDTAVDKLSIENPHLGRAKALVARPSPAGRGRDDAVFNEMVQRMVGRMPLLETFV